MICFELRQYPSNPMCSLWTTRQMIENGRRGEGGDNKRRQLRIVINPFIIFRLLLR